MKADLSPPLPKYVQIAQTLAQMIDNQTFKARQRLPSVRDIAIRNQVSISTAMQAFRWLEERNLITAKPKAGYFVSPKSRGLALPSQSKPPKHSLAVQRRFRSDFILAPDPAKSKINFAGTMPNDPAFFSEEKIRVAVNKATRLHRNTLITYGYSRGAQSLRNAVAQRALHLGCHLNPDNIVITASCIHSIGLCLQAVTKPGDIVALESPAHFGFLDLLEALGLRALEIPTHPTHGMSLEALQLALDTHPVRAVLTCPTLSNPIGAVMPRNHKSKLVELLAHKQIPLIEDVVFNDLMASDERRKAAKAFDPDGWVMICGSFSKTITPGLRLGWTEAGRWTETIKRLKRVTGASTNTVLEEALADLLTQSGYEARMRRLADFLRQRLQEARAIIQPCFPSGSRVSNPSSGYTLWLELPRQINTNALLDRCMAEGISFCPGSLFSASEHFTHCLRLSFAGTWTETEHIALARIGELAKQQLA